MWLVNLSLRRPVTLLIAIVAVVLLAVIAINRMAVDIFPKVGAPTIYVAQPYGGMDPQQMEGYLTYYYEYHFLYITGIEHVESKSIQGVALVKLQFHPNTDMDQAMAETVAYVNRARAFMPPGAVPPFVTRFDAGSVAVGQLVFTSPNRSPGEMQDIALNRVRPLFATLEGVSAPPPFGGNQRTIVVRVDPERLRAYGMSPEEAVTAVSRASTVLPSGNVRIGDLTTVTSTNAVTGGDFSEILDAPVRTGSGPTIFVHDIGTVESGTDIVTGYAHVNGRRTVYIPVTKRADASTLDVIRRVRAALPSMKAVVPDDVDVRLEFDQSSYVSQALRSLLFEALLGAGLTGLMVLVFLRDVRSAFIVILTIPIALLASTVGLWLSGQTINLMTLAGLALAVGVLVDEATVEIENINAMRSESQDSVARVVLDAATRTARARFLSMLCVLAVFAPALLMTGAGRQLFVPLSLSIAFAMLASYALSSSLVPVLSVWWSGRHKGEAHDAVSPWRDRYSRVVERAIAWRVPLALVYAVVVCAVFFFVYPHLGTEIFPNAESAQYQLRLRAPTGTRIERTEVIALKALDVIADVAGRDNVEITTDFVGVQPASYPINTIHLWTSGPQEAVLKVALKKGLALHGESFREKVRERLAKEMPNVRVSFESADIIGQVMSFGSTTPVEVAVQGPALPANRAQAAKIFDQVKKLPFLRDLEYGQPFDYPTVQVDIDRERAGQYGLGAASVARSLVEATSSSRFIEPNFWRDPASGNAFQIQVEVPQNRMQSVDDMRSLPVSNNARLGDVADLKMIKSPGLVERYNMQRVVSMTANLHDLTLGAAIPKLQEAIAQAGQAPKGVTVALRGQVPALLETLRGLRYGLLVAILAIFLLLAANFQSLRLAFLILLVIPAVLAGALLALFITGTTLNVQSFIGTIMACGIAVANSILIVSFTEADHRRGDLPNAAAVAGARGRVRAVIMTAIAMIAGMLPMALGLGENGAQTAPLGRAVIGGLLAATLATLFLVPSFYVMFLGRARAKEVSLHPHDPESEFYEVA